MSVFLNHSPAAVELQSALNSEILHMEDPVCKKFSSVRGTKIYMIAQSISDPLH